MPRLLSEDDFPAAVIKLLFGASESIPVHASRVDQRDFGFSLEDLGASMDNRLELLCLLPPIGVRRNRDGTLSREPVLWGLLNSPRAAQESFEGSGWYLRLVPNDASPSASLIVNSTVVVHFNCLNDSPGPYYSDEPLQLAYDRNRFEVLREEYFDVSALEILYTQEEAASTRSDTITIASYGAWVDLIALFCRSSPKFEEFIAELLTRQGLDPILTPPTHDGGRDILAVHDTPVGRHLYLVERKGYQKGRPVEVAVVRQLHTRSNISSASRTTST